MRTTAVSLEIREASVFYGANRVLDRVSLSAAGGEFIALLGASEDDIFCDLQVKTTPRLATLDQLARVIYTRSFSKTLSGSLRVGFVACSQHVADELADIKLTSITTSPFTERLIYLMLVEGHYRKYLSRLHERLGEAHIEVERAFERIGLELFAEPADGMFVWALPAY